MFGFINEEATQANALLNECVEIIKVHLDRNDLIDRIFGPYPATALDLLDPETRVEWLFKIVKNEDIANAPEEFRDFCKFLYHPLAVYDGQEGSRLVRNYPDLIGKLGKIACLRYFIDIAEEVQIQSPEEAQDPEERARRRQSQARQEERLQAPPELTNIWLKEQIGKLLIQELRDERGPLLEGWWERELAEAEQAREQRRLIPEEERQERVRQEAENAQRRGRGPAHINFEDFSDIFHEIPPRIAEQRIAREREAREQMRRLREQARQREREQATARRWAIIESFINLHNSGRFFLDRPERSFKEKILFYLNISTLLPLFISFWQACRNAGRELHRFFTWGATHSIGFLLLKSLGLTLAFFAGSMVLSTLMLMSVTSLPLSLLCDAIRGPQGCARDNNKLRVFCVSLIAGIDFAKDMLLASYLLPLISLKWLVGILPLCTMPLAVLSISMRERFADRPMNNRDIPRDGDERGFPLNPPAPRFHHQYGMNPLPPRQPQLIPNEENERRPRVARRLIF